MENIIIQHKDLIIPITVSGEGKPIIFCNGLGSTQPHWKMVVDALKSNYKIITFDFRGHGMTSPSVDYSFDGFTSDILAVVGKVKELGLEEKPVIVAWSLGADLAVNYVASHPNEIARLILIDGAVPVPEPIITDEAELRKKIDTPELRENIKLAENTPYACHLTIQNLGDINIELDARRKNLLELYKQIDCPITMIMADKSAGEKENYAERINKLWHTGVDRLKLELPQIEVTWLPGDHQLIFSNANYVAEIIDNKLL